MLRTIEAVEGALNRLGKLVSYLVFAMTGVIMFEIVSRYAFNAPTVWGQDVSGWLEVTYVFLGGAYALQNDHFVRVDLFFDRMPEKVQAIIDLTVTTVLFAAFLWVMIGLGWGLAMQSFAMNETSMAGDWGGPVWPAKFMVPVGAALLGLAWLCRICRLILRLTGRGPRDDHHEIREMGP